MKKIQETIRVDDHSTKKAKEKLRNKLGKSYKEKSIC